MDHSGKDDDDDRNKFFDFNEYDLAPIYFDWKNNEVIKVLEKEEYSELIFENKLDDTHSVICCFKLISGNNTVFHLYYKIDEQIIKYTLVDSELDMLNKLRNEEINFMKMVQEL